MSSEESAPSESRSRIVGLIGGILVLVFVVYPLSTGPALYLVEIGWIHMRTFELVYQPLESLSHPLPVLDTFFRWYVMLWIS